MNEIELKKLWNGVSKIYDINTFEIFKSKMTTPEQRKSFYDKLTAKEFDLGDYYLFENRLSGALTDSNDILKSTLGNSTPSTQPQQEWYMPIFNWAKGRPGKHKVSPSGDYFWYYPGTGEIWNFSNKDGFFSWDDGNNGTPLQGKWSVNGKSFKINTNNGMEFTPETNKWVRVSTPPSNKSNQTPNQIPTTITGDQIKNGSIVKSGMRGPIVGEIQKSLIEKGYTDISNNGKPDNIFGPKTSNSIKKFQTENDLTPDGVVGPKTWEKLSATEQQATKTNLDYQPDSEVGPPEPEDEKKQQVWPITPEKPKEYIHPEDQKINEHVKNIVRKNLLSLIK